MAITNTQQYKQLVNPPMKGKKRPGYRGDAAYRSRSAQSNPSVGGQGNVGTQASFGESDKGSSQSTVFGPTRPPDDAPTKATIEKLAYEKGVKDLENLYDDGLPKVNIPYIGPPLNAVQKFRDITLRKNIDYFTSDDRTNMDRNKYPKTLQGYLDYNADRQAGLIDAGGNLIPETLRANRDEPILIPDATGIMNQAPEDMDQETETEDDEFKLARAFRADGGRIGFKGGADMGTVSTSTRAATAKSANVSPTGSVTTSRDRGPDPVDDRGSSDQNMVQMLVNAGYTPKEIRKITEGPTVIDRVKEGPLNNPLTRGIIRAGLYTVNPALGPIDFRRAMQLKNLYDATADSINNPDEEDLTIGFAKGGPVGGIMDLESGRQMYFLGKLVKKATRAVKKIVKSPIGKIALIGGGLGLAGIGPFKDLASSPFGTGLTKNFLKFKGSPIGEAIFGKAQVDDMKRTGGLLDLIRGPMGLITAASAVAGALTPEQEQEAQELADNTGFSIEEARNAILQAAKENYAMDVRTRGFKADGGIMRDGYQEGSKEPVAKKTMPLLDMDGKEMDFREGGGFVPIGRMEKADDVPARLSKNEFVFTADAVRNAGDGNVDKGAEVMYNMMKNLESGGDVSEESQGLSGARRMFQTSQRLEEVL